ncbi:EAL domain-containing protein [Paenibacillus wynnii]|uniref:EAL domain-containing protein n=1 Tax=Paenibacillus wynnii TaxID=268407 RepID=UPI0027930F86|nr:EAL domain-containing protein [Paenibacillus wynnii]MDQ0193148.1 EAL domain-containing protein (putative c-di-GMP-specific phosphodiesterase class I) [Paenibacillus wynnii]
MNKRLQIHRQLSAIPYYFQHLNERMKNEMQELKKLGAVLDIVNKGLMDTYFQPILQLQSGQTIGHEVLNRPPTSPQFPTTELFYEFAGETELMFRLEKNCRRMSLTRYVERLTNPTIENDNTKLIFINMHPGILNDSRHKSGETVELMKGLGLSPSRVVFELTERQAVQDYASFEKALSHYRDQGFRIAVDDAGSGYNSLKTIVYLKPEFIKLDKSLIRGINNNSEQQELLELIREYAHRSSTRVIAEGIETKEELYFLQKSGIDYGQGYALGRPVSQPTDGSIKEYVDQGLPINVR